MSEEPKKGKGFVFVDKRKTQGETEQAGGREGSTAEPTPRPKAPADRKGAEPKKRSLPQVDFNFFILSLSSSAMMQMGVIPNPVTKQKETDLEMAKQTIDIIAMLEKKTQGNLTPEEQQFIEAILYDLRMKFVEVSK